MLMILIALITLTVFAVVTFIAGEALGSILCLVFGTFSAIVVVIGLPAFVFSGWSYLAAEYKADIINREYGTNYTQEEIYWAADVIDTIRELDRKRIEMNGDLIAGERGEK